MKLFALLLLACCATSFAADAQSLKGIAGIWVLVENLNPDLQKAGLSKEELRSDIEDRLREAGIAVEEPRESGAGPFLYIELTDIAVPAGGKRKSKPNLRREGTALYVRLELQQSVALKREPSSSLLSDTWHQSLIGYAEPARAGEVAKGWVRELTDRFVKAYRTANPQ
ncbi:MAG: hypothetical protein ACR2I2_23330 [Bryobacteraceae bacterium]